MNPSTHPFSPWLFARGLKIGDRLGTCLYGVSPSDCESFFDLIDGYLHTYRESFWASASPLETAPPDGPPPPPVDPLTTTLSPELIRAGLTIAREILEQASRCRYPASWLEVIAQRYTRRYRSNGALPAALAASRVYSVAELVATLDAWMAETALQPAHSDAEIPEAEGGTRPMPEPEMS